jgi:hypothetical protein
MRYAALPWAVALGVGMLAQFARAADAPAAGAPRLLEKPDVSAAGLEVFEKHVRPVLIDRCYKCHSETEGSKVKGGLRLDTREGLLRGGDSGKVIVPGEPARSLLITAVGYHDQTIQMPPKEPLSREQVAYFEQWVKLGAPDPRTDRALAAPPEVADKGAYDWQQAKKFWSFAPVKEHAVPAVKNQSWALTDIDRFVLAAMEAKGLRPVKVADRRTLIRRVTFDLTGLPPTPQEVEAFVRDESPSAWATVVERLLASPAYGEKWGRHWLDVARYADTSGCNSDYPVPSAYKYRNYVINSFNADKPYDRFLAEQLAGDLMPAASEQQREEQVVATGYLANARRFGSRNSEFHLTIEDTIDNVGKAMLGLSVSCARCHDHKYDPVPQSDYYALYGIFSSTKYAFPGTEIYRHTKDFALFGTREQVAKASKWEQDMAALDDKAEELTQEIKKYQAAIKLRDKLLKSEHPNDHLMARAMDTARRLETVAFGKRNYEEVKADIDEVKSKVLRLENNAPEIEKAYAVSDKPRPADARIHKKGEPKTTGAVVRRGFLTVLGGQKLPEGYSGSGRLELAKWVTDPNNPLTARVMVNRIWQGHFGKGIVQSANDFGARGKRPTHPELLDYLARRFVESGWSVKAMHRLILMSRVYQLASVEDGSNARMDPAIDHLWRFNPRRLSAEEVRDAMLLVSGALDPGEGPGKGGEHPFPEEKEWKYTQHKQFFAVYETDRRSVYMMQQRLRKHPFMEVFDGADTNASTAERAISITPLQALFVMNNPLAHRLADEFAVRVGMAMTDDAERVQYAHRLAFGRAATDEEVQAAREYLAECRAKLKEAGVPWEKQGRAALASYARMLMASNEFFFID